MVGGVMTPPYEQLVLQTTIYLPVPQRKSPLPGEGRGQRLNQRKMHKNPTNRSPKITDKSVFPASVASIMAVPHMTAMEKTNKRSFS
jgi:hypothetical protein